MTVKYRKKLTFYHIFVSKQESYKKKPNLRVNHVQVKFI
jgi:hypothetical protein